MATLTAMLTGNKRGIGTLSPLVLLINIMDNNTLDRSHCWVKLTPDIQSIMPKGHHKPRKVSIEAEPIEYIRRGSDTATTLNITSLSLS